MKEPMMIQHQAYLNDLESMAKATHKRSLLALDGLASNSKVHGTIFVAAFIAIIAFVPWTVVPI